MDRYLVKLKNEVNMTGHIGRFSHNYPDGHVVTHTWDINDNGFLNAYAGLCHRPPPIS
jgi:hypothetical protein